MESKQQMYAFESQGTVFEAKVFGKEMHRRKKKKKGPSRNDAQGRPGIRCHVLFLLWDRA